MIYLIIIDLIMVVSSVQNYNIVTDTISLSICYDFLMSISNILQCLVIFFNAYIMMHFIDVLKIGLMTESKKLSVHDSLVESMTS